MIVFIALFAILLPQLNLVVSGAAHHPPKDISNLKHHSHERHHSKDMKAVQPHKTNKAMAKGKFAIEF